MRNKEGLVDDLITSIPGEWKFDEQVSQHFDTHVRKSVPLYEEVQKAVIEISEFSALIFSTNIKAPPSTNPLYIRCKTFFLFHKGKNCNVYNDKTKSILANSFISSICCCRN